MFVCVFSQSVLFVIVPFVIHICSGVFSFSLFVFPLGINLSLHHIYCQLQSATIPANPNTLTDYEPSMTAESRTVNIVPLNYMEATMSDGSDERRAVEHRKCY